MSGAPILIAAGGTGGHMFPALALSQALTGRGREVTLVTDRRGARYVRDSSLPVTIVAAGSPSGSPLAKVRALAQLGRGSFESFALLRRRRPAAAAALGGYASVPAAVAAGVLRVPLLVHEQNAIFGRANRLCARFARMLALSFDATAHVPERAGVVQLVTGNPTRPGFAAAPMERTDDRFRLLVLGGSQGAKVFSDVLPAAMALLPPLLRQRVDLAQQCRPEDIERVRTAYAAENQPVELAMFFDDVPARMAAADLVVTRSGASTVAELLNLGRPALLVPYKHAADDHQTANARALQAAGAALLMTQDELTPASLAALLERLIRAPEQLGELAAAARRLARLDAAQRLADAVLALAEDAQR